MLKFITIYKCNCNLPFCLPFCLPFATPFRPPALLPPSANSFCCKKNRLAHVLFI